MAIDDFPIWWSTKARDLLGTRPDQRTRIASGLPTLDKWTLGFHPGKLTVAAGRPGAGKTSFATTITANVMKRKNTPVTFISTELTEVEVIGQIAEAMAGGIPIYPNGRVSTANETNTLSASLDELALQEKYSILQITYEKKLSLKRIREAVQLTAPEDGRDHLVIIDQASRIQRDDANGRRSYALATEHLLNDLEALAEESKAAILVMTQLNRGAEYQKKPMLANLKHSGAFEEYAHCVILLDKDDNNGHMAPGGVSNAGTIHVAKNRSGRTGGIDAMFFGVSHTWKEAAPGGRDETKG